MSYTQGQRVRHLHGRIGTVSQDAPDHAVVRVMWDDEYIPRWELPECIVPEGKQAVASARDAWAKARAR